MRATNFEHMRFVFLEEPCKLFTFSIQRAYVHLANDGDEQHIPEIKSDQVDYEKFDESDRNESYTKYLGYDNSASESLESFSLRYYHMTLVLPKRVKI